MDNIKKFVEQYAPVVQPLSEQLGVAPEILLGQFGLETGWGKSVIPGTNNLGNIKDFSGKGPKAKDNMTKSVDAYRAYATPEEFANDYGSLIKRRYKDAVGVGADAKAYATALKAGGYAEDPTYISKMEKAANLVRKFGDKALSAISGTAYAAQPKAAPVGDINSKIAKAREAGYSDAEIMDYLGQTPGFSSKIQKAREAGYSDEEIQQFLGFSATKPQAAAPQQAQAPDAPQQERSALENFGTGLWQGVGDAVIGAGQLVGNTLSSAANAISPDSAISKNLGQRASNYNDMVRQREKEYQDATPGSFAAGTGRVIGTLANPIANVGKAATAVGKVAQAAGAGALGGLVAPETQEGTYWENRKKAATTGTIVGGVLGGAGVLASKGINSALSVSPEVAALAQAAKEKGINIRPDQLTNSKVIKNLSAVLDNIPFTGKAKDIANQQKQFNVALSKTIGENSDNLITATENAAKRLGAEFDQVLKNTTIKVDNNLQDDLVRIATEAGEELTDQQIAVVNKQINNILNKVKEGDVLDAKAGYVIKKRLDNLAKNQDSSISYYAKELRSSLFDALNRSLPDGGKGFAETRKQWGNLRELEKMIPAGVEGDISAGRLANARGVNSKDLKQLRDVAGQFLKETVPNSGTVQRGLAAGALGGTIGLPGLAGAVAGGRAANTLFGSDKLAQAMINRSLNPQETNKLFNLINPAAYGIGMASGNQ